LERDDLRALYGEKILKTKGFCKSSARIDHFTSNHPRKSTFIKGPPVLAFLFASGIMGRGREGPGPSRIEIQTLGKKDNFVLD